jgi:dihydroxyacetone kinase-like protein
MELLIVGRAAARILTAQGITIHAGLAGNYCTSQEMAGCSLTLMRLDDELRSLWNDPASSPGFSQPVAAQRG